MTATGSLMLARATAPDRAAPSQVVMPFERPVPASWPDSWPDVTPPRQTAVPAQPCAVPDLMNFVANSIVPRLVAAHRHTSAQGASLPAQAPKFAPRDVAEFALLVLAADAAPRAYVDAALLRGAGVADIYLELLAPAARRLGHLWDIDEASFAGVTIGLGRLHAMLRALAPEFHRYAPPPRPGRRALLVAQKGEQQRFALAVSSEFFRRAAWQVQSDSAEDPHAARAMAHGAWFDIVAWVATGTEQPDGIESCIRRLRAASRNRRIGVILACPNCIDQKRWSGRLGADATACDAAQAVEQAETFLALLVPRVSGGRETNSWRDA